MSAEASVAGACNENGKVKMVDAQGKVISSAGVTKAQLTLRTPVKQLEIQGQLALGQVLLSARSSCPVGLRSAACGNPKTDRRVPLHIENNSVHLEAKLRR